MASTVYATSQTPRRVQGGRDGVLWTLLIGAAVLSVVAFLVTYRKGNVLAYNDAISHMEIARRVVSSNNPGFAQLGTVWLPLPHLLMLPLVWINGLYYSGIAGAVISMAAFVACCVLIYKILLQLTGSKTPGVVGAVVFAVNVNILYVQSTPMTETLLFATILAMVYYLQVWTDTHNYRHLVGAAAAAFAATLTRYESWPILAVLAVAVFIAAWRERRHHISGKTHRGRVQDILIAFLVLAGAGVAFWLIWNQVLFGDFLAFQRGEYAKPSLWLTSNEPAIGHFGLAAKTFWLATLANIPWPLLIVAALGLVAFIEIEMIMGRFNPRSLVVPSVLCIVPFFIFAIYTGQRPLHVMQINHDLYNVRFGLIMAIPVSLFVGYAVGFFRKFSVVKVVVGVLVVALAAIVGVQALNKNNIVTLADPVAVLKAGGDNTKIIDKFKSVYDDGDVLVTTFGNERFVFKAVPSGAIVYEGTNKEDRWNQSLANPASHGIKWIFMRCITDNTDLVCDNFQRKPDALAGYTQVFTDGNYKIYKRS